MKKWIGLMAAAFMTAGIAKAQTDGGARMEVTLVDYNGSGQNHWTVVWVTTEGGAFIKTLWKQGTRYSFTSSQWTTHCPDWNAARGGPNGSTIVDGYTSATATSYSGTNSPVILTWNCRDTNNVVVPDGRYKFWVQYAEDSSSPGPVTTGGLLWTKGPSGATNTYPNQGANFANMKVTWTPSTPATVAPTITSAPPPATGTVGSPYSFTSTATGTAPITFSALGLPPGLSMSSGGVISGKPTTVGTYSGSITAINGTLPNATQNFTITVNSVPLTLAVAQLNGNQLVMNGTGPANGSYRLLTSSSLTVPASGWTATATNSINASGAFSVTNTILNGTPQTFYILQLQ